MNTTTSKGDRKLSVNRHSGLLLLLGLLIVLVAAGFFKMEVSACVQYYVVFAGGLVGKDTAFVWGNAQEHKAAAQLEVKP